MKHTQILIELLFFLSIVIAPKAHSQSVVQLIGDSSAKVGIYIENLVTGQVVTDIEGDVPLIPASITKSITAATVLAERDPDWRFTTPVIIDGPVNDGRLDGNVIIATNGDPTLESAYFPDRAGFADSIACTLIRMGINEVKGSVKVRENDMLDEPVPGGWMDEDIVWPYGAGHHSTNFRDNRFVLTLPSKVTNPMVPDLKVRIHKSRGKVDYDRKRGSETVTVKGRVGKRKITESLATPVPSKVMLHEIANALERAGIEVKNHHIGHHEKEDTVYVHESPLLTDILQSMMFRSDNMFAEGMLRSIDPSKPRSKVAAEELDTWADRDMDIEGLIIEDGSGLSRRNRLTPYFMADVYVWMSEHPSANDFIGIFPKAGMDGTMSNFLKGTELEGRLAMKTGSMRGVQSYAGYCLDQDGVPTHVVVVMVNGFTCSRARLKAAIENFLLRTLVPDNEPDTVGSIIDDES